MPALLGWCDQDKCSPRGSPGWAGRGGLFDSKRKKNNENAFVFTTTSKTMYRKDQFPCIAGYSSCPCLSPRLSPPGHQQGPGQNPPRHTTGPCGTGMCTASQHGLNPWPFCSRGGNGCTS